MHKIFQKHTIIAVDCDEVLASTYQYFLDFYNLYNTLGEKIQFSDLRDYNFSQNKYFGNSSDEFVEMFIQFFHADEKTLLLPPILGAKELLATLKKSGKKFYVITARQSFFEEYTKNWIEKYFPGIFENIFFCNHEGGGIYLHKSEVCKKLGATLLLEDNMDYALECAEEGVEVLLFEKPWNEYRTEKHEKIYSINGWEEL